MKKILGGLVLSVLLAGPVMAADMPVKARPAPVVVALYKWTGCYIGGHVGIAWGRKRVNDLTAPITTFNLNHDIEGFGAGGQIGCNVWQNDRWVLGIEGQATWIDMDGEAFTNSTAFTTSGFRTDVNVIGSVAGRLGYAAGSNGQVLFFVKGGAAFIDEKFSAGFSGGPLIATGDNDLRWGWMIGGGVEAVITGNWTWKAEYNYSDFGTRNVRLCTPAQLCDDFSVRQRVQLFKMGINYRFDWASPVVARF
jgi:outer membrane immunogenic protein